MYVKVAYDNFDNKRRYGGDDDGDVFTRGSMLDLCELP